MEPQADGLGRNTVIEPQGDGLGRNTVIEPQADGLGRNTVIEPQADCLTAEPGVSGGWPEGGAPPAAGLEAAGEDRTTPGTGLEAIRETVAALQCRHSRGSQPEC